MNRPLIIALASVFVVLAMAAGYVTVQNREDRMSRMAQSEVHMKKGVALFNRELFEEALLEFGKIQHDVKQDWRVPYYQGSASIKLHRYEEAVSHLDRAFTLNSEEARIPFALGVAYYRLGKLGMAKGYFAAAAELDPSNEDAKGLMGVMADLERQQVAPSPDEPTSEETDGGT